MEDKLDSIYGAAEEVYHGLCDLALAVNPSAAGDTETCTVQAERSCEESGGACTGTPVEEPTCG